MNYGVIDLGSNSVRLEIFKYENKELKNIYSKRAVVGLASYMLPEGYLSDLGIKSAIDIVSILKEESNAFDIKKLYIIATATIRNARNQNEIINRINHACGVKVELLDEKTEALLGVKGIQSKTDIQHGVVLDIGGGSTEVTLIKDSKVTEAHSLPLGSLNSFITFVKEILPTKEEKERIQKAVLNALSFSKVSQMKFDYIYGIGGSLKAAKVLIESLSGKKIEYITKNNVKDLISKIDPAKKQTYLSIIRMIPERLHTILPGLIILDTIMNYFDIQKVYISQSGIREGYILQHIKAA